MEPNLGVGIDLTAMIRQQCPDAKPPYYLSVQLAGKELAWFRVNTDETVTMQALGVSNDGTAPVRKANDNDR